MKSRTGWIVGVVVIVAATLGAYWYFKPNISLQQIGSFENEVESSTINKVAGTFSGPAPLRAPTSSASQPVPLSQATLTRAGVITDTNVQRKENGDLPALAENATLDEIATFRLNDMFAKQYFAHVAPNGSSAETVASSVGYTYLALGENLALGNFAGDTGVVTAWMNSPGHRANILNTHYTQIGVAVGEGKYQGEATWIAVQVFGRPASDCPAPDADLNATINTEEAQITALQADLQTKKAELNNSDQTSVNTYNAEVNEYNGLIAIAKTQIAQYNAQVDSYNTCISS